MFPLAPAKKQQLARIVRVPLARWLLGLSIRLFVPRQRIGVAIVGLDDLGRILMLRHVFHPHTPWGLPGGWLARDESPAECAHRELWEETGLTANLGPVIHLSREPKPPHLGIVFLAKIVPGQVKLSTEILEATWFESDSLPSPLLPFVEEAIVKAKDFTVQSLME